MERESTIRFLCEERLAMRVTSRRLWRESKCSIKTSGLRAVGLFVSSLDTIFSNAPIPSLRVGSFCLALLQ